MTDEAQLPKLSTAKEQLGGCFLPIVTTHCTAMKEFWFVYITLSAYWSVVYPNRAKLEMNECRTDFLAGK